MGTASIVSAALRRLEGKVALITGGASGIGECTAKLFSNHGAKVVIADVQDELGHALSKDLNNSSSFVHCDVTNESQVRHVVDTVISNYGKLDIMFNNAGVLGVAKPNILDHDLSDFKNVINVNLIGSFLGTKHAARVMIPARRGSIITTASICSVVGGIGSYAYTSSKHGVVGLMRNSAVELGQHGIRVNCVSPYVVPTPMANYLLKFDKDEEYDGIYSNLKGDNGKYLLKREDIAEAVLYLGSDESKYVSGHNLVVDGGFTIFNHGFCAYGQ